MKKNEKDGFRRLDAPFLLGEEPARAGQREQAAMDHIVAWDMGVIHRVPLSDYGTPTNELRVASECRDADIFIISNNSVTKPRALSSLSMIAARAMSKHQMH
jgi:hypothetical protein